jgi:hypothetical protein
MFLIFRSGLYGFGVIAALLIVSFVAVLSDMRSDHSTFVKAYMLSVGLLMIWGMYEVGKLTFYIFLVWRVHEALKANKSKASKKGSNK